MQRRSNLVIALLLGSIGLLGVLLWQQHHEVVELRVEALRVNSALANVAKLKQALASAQAIPRAASVVAPKTNPPQDTRSPAAIAIAKKVRGIDLKYQRWTALGKNAALITEMNLPPEKLSKFKDFLVARDRAESAARKKAEEMGLPQSDVERAVEDAHNDGRREMFASLSETEQIKLSELELANMTQVSGDVRMNGYFVDLGLPLTADQSAAIARTRGQLAFQEMFLGTGVPKDPQAGLAARSLSYSKILDKTAQVLSPEQLAGLKDYFGFDEQIGALMTDYAAAVKGSASAASNGSR